MLQHFLLLLTPLGTCGKIIFRKNSKGTSVLFKVPCGCFDLVCYPFFRKFGHFHKLCFKFLLKSKNSGKHTVPGIGAAYYIIIYIDIKKI